MIHAYSFTANVSESFAKKLQEASKPAKVYFVRQNNLYNWAKNLCFVDRLKNRQA
jgi:hypothetical protein